MNKTLWLMCGVDSHNNYPVNIDQAIVDMYAQMDKCKKQL